MLSQRQVRCWCSTWDRMCYHTIPQYFTAYSNSRHVCNLNVSSKLQRVQQRRLFLRTKPWQFHGVQWLMQCSAGRNVVWPVKAEPATPEGAILYISFVNIFSNECRDLMSQPGICWLHMVFSMHSVSCPFPCSQTIYLGKETHTHKHTTQ